MNHDIGGERSKRANVRDGKKRRLSVAGPLEMKYLPDVVNYTSENTRREKESEDKPQERDLLAEICELTEKFSFSKFSVERFSSNDDDTFFYTGFQSYEALIAFWNFVKPSGESLLSWNQVRFKVNGDFPDTAFPFLQG